MTMKAASFGEAKPRMQLLRGILVGTALLVVVLSMLSVSRSTLCNNHLPGHVEQPRKAGPASGPSKAPVCILQASDKEIGQLPLADASMYGWSSYAELHGYKYVKVIDPRGPPNPKAPKPAQTCQMRWRKVAALRHVLPQCELLMLVDYDTAMVDPSIPITALLQRWGFTETHLIAQPLDPGHVAYDHYELPNGSTIHSANTGMMIWRNTPRSLQILEQFWSAPFNNPPVPVLQKPPCDQGVWNKLVRPTLAPGELLLLPCDEANGYPNARPHGKPANCSGRFIRHYWDTKHLALAHHERMAAKLMRKRLVDLVGAAGGLQRLGVP